MKKRGLVVLFVALFMLNICFVLAQSNSSNTTAVETENSDDAIEKGYACLQDKVNAAGNLSLQESIFSALALGNQEKLISEIEAEKKSNEFCWPKSSCKIKDTAQVAVAYNLIGKDTENIEKWLISKNGSAANDLTWYLQVDIQNHVPSNCSIKYDNRESKIKILSDMKLEATSISCMSISASGYWLKIDSSCLTKKFTISCGEDFVTNLLYEKKNGGVIYVSSDTHSASSLGVTEEEITAKCFKIGNVCDYEGTLWATLALQRTGHDVASYIPYLLSNSEDNRNFFPSTFLYILTGREDQYAQIIQNQKQNRYWEVVGTRYGRYYDTSLALSALTSSSGNEVENAKDYLLSIQGKDGCWNNGNIRDTAFLLYSGWPQQRTGGSTGNGTGTGSILCEDGGVRSCENRDACLEVGGDILVNYECTGLGEFCCSVSAIEPSCQAKGGITCTESQECKDSAVVSSSDDAICCTSACIDVEVEENTCEIAGGDCKYSCSSSEEEITESCSLSGQVCCAPKEEEKKGSLWWLWILLIILIILLILAYIFRDKLGLWFEGMKKKKDGKPPASPGVASKPVALPSRPGARPGAPVGRPGQTYALPSGRRPAPAKDRELEDTLKKLREMTK